MTTINKLSNHSLFSVSAVSNFFSLCSQLSFVYVFAAISVIYVDGTYISNVTMSPLSSTYLPSSMLMTPTYPPLSM
ncbi:unnamed protein product, partial [Brassica rapa subsp. trilocularis]